MAGIMGESAMNLLHAGLRKLPDHHRCDPKALLEAVAHMITIGMASTMVLLMERVERRG